MTDIRYDIGQLFQLAFGINSPIYLTQPILARSSPSIIYQGANILPDFEEGLAQEEMPKSWMNTPIVFSASLDGDDGMYWSYKMNGELAQVKMKTMEFPPATMFSFRRAKNITRTHVLGSNGTVKEIYGFDDWQIDVRGVCLPTSEKSSIQQLEALLEWENIADAVKINGSLFNKAGIHRVAISDIAWNIPQGKPDVIAFTMQLLSDDPLELQLTNTI